MAARASLKLFGDFRLTGPGGAAIELALRKAQAIVALVALAPGQSVARERLAGLLWAESDPQRARQSLRQALFGLSKSLAQGDAGFLHIDNQRLFFDSTAVEVDVLRFEDLVSGDDPGKISEALALYDGDLLTGFMINEPDFDAWLEAARTRLQELAVRSFVKLLEHQVEKRRDDVAIETAKRILTIDSCREEVHRTLMQIYLRKGLRTSALAQFRLCRNALAAELEVEPGQETQALYRKILEQDGAELSEGLAEGEQGNEDVRILGRRSELASLATSLQDAKQGRSQCLLVTGELGVGKSRLSAWVQERALENGFRCLAIRGRRGDRFTRLGALSELLFGLLPDDPEGGLAKLSQSAAKRLRCLLPGSQAESTEEHCPDVEASDLGAALTEALMELSADGPILMVLEDAQEIDESSLATLLVAMERSEELPIMLLFTAGPDPQEGEARLESLFHEFEQSDTLRLQRLQLEPLQRRDAEKLALAIARNLGVKVLSKARLARICDLSDGNPRLIEQILAREMEAQRDSNEVTAPPALTRDVRRRLDRLSPNAQTLMMAAACARMPTGFEVLAAACSLTEEQVGEAIDEVDRVGLARLQDDKLVLQRPRFGLVLYESLSTPTRCLWHKRLVAALEEQSANPIESHYGEIAWHHERARRPAEAFRFHVLNANLETRRGHPAKARRCLVSALRILDAEGPAGISAEQRADLHMLLARLGELNDDHTAWQQQLNAALACAEEADDTLRCSMARLELSRLRFLDGELEDALACARRAVSGQRVEESIFWLLGDRVISHLGIVTGHRQKVLQNLRRRRASCRDIMNRADEAELASAIGLLAMLDGDYDEAMRHCQSAVELSNAAADEVLLSACMQFRAMVLAWHGEFEASLESFGQAEDLARARGHLLRLYSIHGFRGQCLVAAERHRLAAGQLDQALELADKIGIMFMRPLFLASRAEAACGLDEPDVVLDLSREALDCAAAANQPWASAIALSATAQALGRGSALESRRAEQAIKAAIDATRGLGLRAGEGRAQVLHGKILRRQGNLQGARQIFAEAGDVFEAIGLLADCDRARTLAQTLSDRSPVAAE